MTPIVYTWVILALIFVAIYAGVERLVECRLERMVLASAGGLLSLLVGVGATLWLSGSLRLVIIVPTACLVTALILHEVRRSLPVTFQAAPPQMHLFVVAGLMAAVLVLSFGRQFQYQSFWGDDGVYLTAASHYASGGKVTFDYGSIASSLSPGQESLRPLNGVNKSSAGGFQFHALPGWPATMALLGLPVRGSAALSLLFSLSIGLFYFSARRIIADDRAALKSTLVLALLPLAWFQALYPTGEMLLFATVLSAGAWVAATARTRWLLPLGVLAYGVVHISYILLAPILAALLFVVGIFSDSKRKSDLAQAAILSTLAGVFASIFANEVSEKYAHDIASSLFHGAPWADVAIRVAPIIGALPLLFELLGRRWGDRIAGAISLVFVNSRLLAFLAMIGVAVVLVVQSYLLGWTDHFLPKATSQFNSWSARSAYVAMGFKSVEHLAFLSLVGASGVIGVAAFFLMPVGWPKGRPPAGRSLILWLIGFYVVMAFGLTHADIPNNYYASRYFLPFATPALLLLGGAWTVNARPKAVNSLLIILFLPALAYISALLGQGFFLGDQRFLKESLWKVQGKDHLYVEGSSWLRYFLEPSLMRTTPTPSASSDVGLMLASPAHALPSENPILLTDNDHVLGGVVDCRTYIQRRIPWQIGYLLHPDMTEHRICTVIPSKRGHLSWGGNSWSVGGGRQFLVAAPADSTAVFIDVLSEGWWADKGPFVNKPDALNPRLQVCGSDFRLVYMSARKLTFRGQLKAPFCRASFRTATFSPKDYGYGSDDRVLGMDLYSMRIYRQADFGL